jgi:hypothetical protein
VIRSAIQTAVEKIFSLTAKKSFKSRLEEVEYIFCDYEDQYSDVAYCVLKVFSTVFAHKLAGLKSLPENQRNVVLWIGVWFITKLWIISDKLLMLGAAEQNLLGKRDMLSRNTDVTEGTCFDCVVMNRRCVDGLVQALVQHYETMGRDSKIFFLNTLTKEVISKMEKPIMLADFLIAKFDNS